MYNIYYTESYFVVDLRPFVPVKEREKLKDLCGYIKDYILKKIFEF